MWLWLCSVAFALTVTVAPRGMVGAAARVAQPVAEDVEVFVDIGASAWLIYGDDPAAGGDQSPIMLRPHLKLGADFLVSPSDTENPRQGWFIGPRVVGADWVVLDGEGVPFYELVGQGVVGFRNAKNLSVGGGLGAHLLVRDGEAAVFPIPHFELQIPLFSSKVR